MKLSELKKVIKEEFDFTGSDLDEKTAREIDIMIDMGYELLKFQEGKYEYSIRPQKQLRKKLLALHNQSSIRGPEGYFAKFVDDNLGVNYLKGGTAVSLPNTSSGSFMNALIDLDGLLSTMGYEDGKFTDEQYDAATEYYESRRRELI